MNTNILIRIFTHEDLTIELTPVVGHAKPIKIMYIYMKLHVTSLSNLGYDYSFRLFCDVIYYHKDKLGLCC